MVNISDEQIDFILNDIEKRGVITEDVKYNILDHVCCIIENEMPNGADFNLFYRNTIARFYRKELKEIEDETRDLITFKYFYAMKRTLKITGAITIILCLLGSLFKFMHWPGAGIMLVLSLGFFALIFIPLNIILKFKDEKEKTNQLLITSGFILGMGMTLGMLFKIFHWPGANYLMFGSLGVFALIYVPLYFFTRYRNPETKFNAIVNTTFMIAGAGLFFGMINLKNSQNVEDSVAAMDDFQIKSSKQIESSSDAIYSDLAKADEGEFTAFQTVTYNFLNHLDQTRSFLIARSNGQELAEGELLYYKDLKNPNDNQVIKKSFENDSETFSYQSFLQAVDTYNKEVNKFNQEGILRNIDIEGLQMTNTIISVVIQNLNAIQIQALSNENSYLCLQKGLLSAR